MFLLGWATNQYMASQGLVKNVSPHKIVSRTEEAAILI